MDSIDFSAFLPVPVVLSRVGKTNEQMGTNGIKGEVLKEVLKGTLPLNTDALIFGSPNYSLTLTRRSQAHPYLIEVKSSFAGKYVPYIFNHLYPYKCPCNCYINASMHVILNSLEKVLRGKMTVVDCIDWVAL